MCALCVLLKKGALALEGQDTEDDQRAKKAGDCKVSLERHGLLLEVGHEQGKGTHECTNPTQQGFTWQV